MNVYFHQFVWTFLQGQGGPGGETADTADKLEQFAQKYRLNAEARERLEELPPDEQESVISTFKPHLVAGNMGLSTKFLTYLKTHANAVPEDDTDPLEEFQEKWGLNNDAIDRLRDLPVEKQDEVMANFTAPDHTRDMNAFFIAHVKHNAPKKCKSWASGECKLGDRCKFLHSP
eukprot:CAMPEP_0180749508 /NCGR_PEP_ID=MMETSP1038_2-20121128/30625_1 /TAXON_ID=632150 /ORGANISM="Azadinium spinosum, Strain 3D9" /LENGTH=173 /DNA_ID=CAMNT_0022783209 /DNA_START=132 /DNA_END=650 /DNA_ORIENTATION=+